MINPDETLDELSLGNIKIIQKKNGYRFSLDPILLIDFCRIKRYENVIDIGTGSGIIAQVLAKISKAKRIVGLELQKSMVDMAERSVVINGLSKRVEIRQGDVRKIRSLFSAGIFNVVVCNPPYRRAGSGRINPRSEQAIARHELEVKVEDIVKASKYLLKDKGRLYLIYLTERLGELISILRNHRIEPKRLRFIYPKPQTDSDMVLIEAMHNAGAGLKVDPPFYIYNSDGKNTEEFRRLYEKD